MRTIDGLGVTRGGGTAEGAAPSRRVDPRVMAKGIISSKLAELDDKASSLVRTADIYSFSDRGGQR